MGLLQRLAQLILPDTLIAEPKTVQGKLDQVIGLAVWNGIEAEYDDLNLQLTDVATNACYCADYGTCPDSLYGAEAWIKGRQKAQPAQDVPERKTRKVGTPHYYAWEGEEDL